MKRFILFMAIIGLVAMLFASCEATGAPQSTAEAEPSVMILNAEGSEAEDTVVTAGESLTLSASVEHAAADSTVSWTQSVDGADATTLTAADDGMVTVSTTADDADTKIVVTASITVDETTYTDFVTITVNAVTAAPAVPSVEILDAEGRKVEDAVSLLADESLTLTASVEHAADNSTVTWESGDEDVATVQNGVVSGVAEGQAVITVSIVVDRATIATDTVTITVNAVTAAPAVTGVEIDGGDRTLTIGDAPFTLTATLSPEHAVGTVTWESSNTRVASVNSTSGEVTVGTTAGSTTITASVEAGGTTYTGTVTITVERPAVTGVEIDGGDRTLTIGDAPLTLTATLSPEHAVGTVTWESSNTRVASVNSTSGEVTVGTTAGSTTITASVEAGGTTYTGTVTITVERPAVTGVEIDGGDRTLTIGDAPLTLTATLSPEHAVGTVTWESSNTRVASVNSTSGEVTVGTTAGSTTITASVEAGGTTYTGTVTITVERPAVTGVEIDGGDRTLTIGDAPLTLTATLSPEHAVGTVTWESSNTRVASVNSTSGEVTVGTTAGSTTITASVEAGGTTYTGTVTITVERPAVTGVEIDGGDRTLTIGDAPLTLTATLSPEHAVGTVTWESSNTRVASVNSTSGEVTVGTTAGSTTITASVEAGGTTYTGTVTITVERPAVTGVEIDGGDRTLTIGDAPLTLTATLSPEHAVGTVTWESSNTRVASVNSTSGEVTVGTTAGSTTITASVEAGGTTYTGTVTITVERPAVTGVEIDGGDRTLTIGDAPLTLTATLSPEHAVGTVTWESSNTRVASVNSTSGEVTVGTTAGSTTITASVEAGGTTYTGTVTITVERPAVTGVEIDGGDRTLTIGDAPLTLTATLSPEHAVGTVIWASSNISILTVSDNGLVTAVGSGTAEITATLEGNDQISDMVRITVQQQ